MVVYFFLSQKSPWSGLIKHWSFIFLVVQLNPGRLLDPGHLIIFAKFCHWLWKTVCNYLKRIRNYVDHYNGVGCVAFFYVLPLIQKALVIYVLSVPKFSPGLLSKPGRLSIIDGNVSLVVYKALVDYLF